MIKGIRVSSKKLSAQEKEAQKLLKSVVSPGAWSRYQQILFSYRNIRYLMFRLAATAQARHQYPAAILQKAVEEGARRAHRRLAGKQVLTQFLAGVFDICHILFEGEERESRQKLASEIFTEWDYVLLGDDIHLILLSPTH